MASKDYSTIQIKSIGEEPSVHVEVLIDGIPIKGIRHLEYVNDARLEMPILRLDLNALDVSIDSFIMKTIECGGFNVEFTAKSEANEDTPPALD